MSNMLNNQRKGGSVGVAKTEKFQSLHIDTEKGIYEVNGRDISDSGKELHLDFENGQWSMQITEDTILSDALSVKE